MTEIISEKILEKKLVKEVSKMGGWSLKLVSSQFTGLPDRLILMPRGRVWFAEIKTTGKKPKPRQIIVHEMLRKLGFEVFIIDTPEKLDHFLKRIAA